MSQKAQSSLALSSSDPGLHTQCIPKRDGNISVIVSLSIRCSKSLETDDWSAVIAASCTISGYSSSDKTGKSGILLFCTSSSMLSEFNQLSVVSAKIGDRDL